ncbi:MAG: hypothetical protein WAK60_01115 [Sedimentisphaerales bacterium]
MTWLDLLTAAFSGGLAVKLLDYLYKEYRRRSETKKSAKDLINYHIDPILKSADELVGKIRSLAQSDFSELTTAPDPKGFEFDSWIPYLNTLYLFAQFWSRIQILRLESIFVNLSADKRGKILIDFFLALESTRTRLVKRAWQRSMGEALIEHTNNGLRTFTYIEFVNRFLSDNEFRKWFMPLVSIFLRINHTRERQRMLTYGIVIHALIDTLDSTHEVTRDRPGWPNKLTNKSKRDLRSRVFRIYLPFVTGAERYFTVLSKRKQDA